MSFNITSLQKAQKALERSTNITKQKMNCKDSEQDEIEVLQAGVIQTFEFSYELCWKFMKRWIENNISSESVDGVTRIELFRQSAENKLIVDVEKWMTFHHARNKTSHIYDEEVAAEVFACALEFLPYMEDFISRLEKRL